MSRTELALGNAQVCEQHPSTSRSIHYAPCHAPNVIKKKFRGKFGVHNLPAHIDEFVWRRQHRLSPNLFLDILHLYKIQPPLSSKMQTLPWDTSIRCKLCSSVLCCAWLCHYTTIWCVSWAKYGQLGLENLPNWALKLGFGPTFLVSGPSNSV